MPGINPAAAGWEARVLCSPPVQNSLYAELSTKNKIGALFANIKFWRENVCKNFRAKTKFATKEVDWPTSGILFSAKIIMVKLKLVKFQRQQMQTLSEVQRSWRQPLFHNHGFESCNVLFSSVLPSLKGADSSKTKFVALLKQSLKARPYE